MSAAAESIPGFVLPLSPRPNHPIADSVMTSRILLFLLVILVSAAGTARGQLSDTEKSISSYADESMDEAIEFLERVVNINSGTMNPEGVREVGEIFRAELDELGFRTWWEEYPPEIERAGNLYAERTGSQGKRVLLIGHLDTVFEKDSPFQRFEQLNDSIAKGPGVEDMKGGDVIILYALKALHAAGVLDDTQIVVALMGDEEYAGRPVSVSRSGLRDIGRRSDVALGFEGMQGSTGTIARRGFSGWQLTVTGRRAHSSGIFSDKDGAGAIFEAARILDGFYSYVRGERYLTFGAGVILGGTRVDYDKQLSRGRAFGKSNVIPQTVVVDGDLRAVSLEQLRHTQERMRAIVADNLPQTSAEITFDDSFPPMGPTDGNRQLLQTFSDVSVDLGYEPIVALDPLERGAADVSFVAEYVDAIDGLGAGGSGGHTVEERVNLNTIPVATKRAAVLIYRLTR
jgi:glutamate carboxypeptidase